MSEKSNIIKKRIALIGFTGATFKSFSQALEKQGFEVYWITALRSEAVFLKNKLSVDPSKLLDITAGFKNSGFINENILNDYRRELFELENSNLPKIYNIILMDRILRKKSTSSAINYIGHINRVLTDFLIKNEISLVNGGRDTALNLMSMLISKKLNIPWIANTRLRIPLETYGFCLNHETINFVQLWEFKNENRVWAQTFLNNFRKNYHYPAIKRAARNFKDVLFLLPEHIISFFKLLKCSYWDWGNDFQRYFLIEIIVFYIKRRFNLLTYKLIPQYSELGSFPYCIYALHTQPESSIDVVGSFFSDQIALIKFIARSLPITHELYVKVHPTDVDGKSYNFYKKIKKIPSVRLINYNVNTRDLIKNAALVFTLTGTIGYEAGLMGKNVITFAKNFYNDLPTVFYCDAPPKLPNLVNSILNQVEENNVKNKIIDFLADYRTRTVDGEFNRTYGDNPSILTNSDLLSIQKAYDCIWNQLVFNENHN